MSPPQKIELLCFGNAIVDIFAGIDCAGMDRMGITEPVQHIAPERARHILDTLDGFTRGSGGGTANVAKTAARLNVSAAFAGSAGNDEPAAFFESELRSAGVIPLLKKVNAPTGTCLVLHNGEETRIAASPAAALELSENDISEDLIRNAGMVVIDGYILERRAMVRRILRLAAERGIPSALDAASVFVVRENAGEILSACRNYPLLLFMNADESIAFYYALEKGKTEKTFQSDREKEELILAEICPMLKDMTLGKFPVFVIKLGERGALAAAGGSVYRAETAAIESRNTIGAGDAFCAAFLAAWSQGKPIPECLSFGNTVAGKTIKGLMPQVLPCTRRLQ